LTFLQKGDLAEVIEKKTKYDVKQIINWSGDLIEGLYWLHSNKIMHRDIKPS
jgi:serine/threonine protein kinase